MKTILFVCTGNVCRSPMAEGLFRHITKGRADYEVLSAGVGAMNGQPPSPHAVRALQDLNIDIARQRSRALTAAMVEQADYIFGMTQGHVEAIVALYPQAAEKTFVLREFDETLDVFEKDIPDPIGESFGVYASCRDQIEQGIYSMLKFIEQSGPQANAAAPAAGAATWAVGADHAGFELKEALKGFLLQKGMRVADLGTHSTSSTDYPDFAQAVAQQVAGHHAQLGLLVCASGVGMSIAANKVPGIRAANVSDEQMAALTRTHNNANVLCLGAKFVAPDQAKRIIDAFLGARFEGGRHERRLRKLEPPNAADLRLVAVDREVFQSIEEERRRQQGNIELIASENFTSPAVMEAQGSVLTNKYAEGYPKKRWYGGCENMDVVEQLAIDRARQLAGLKGYVSAP